MFFYPDDSEILETWTRNSSFKYFRVVRIEKQVKARQFCFEIYWPLAIPLWLCRIICQILSFEKTLSNYLLTFNTTAASRMSGFTKKSNFEDEFEFLVGGNGSGSDDWKTGNANNNNRIDKGRKISKTFFPVFNSSKKRTKK